MHQPGDLIKERYHILNLLGEGGIATTYAAEDLNISQQVAIKVLSLRRLKDWKALELFEREGKVLAQLEHSGIPKYLDYFQLDLEGDRRFYIVQEIAPGQSLQDWVASGWRPTELEVREIAKQLLDILVYLHQLTPPVVHRDLKPQNIIRQSDGKVFLVDFGAVQDTYRHTITNGSTIVGTYGYMAPEQFRGQAKPPTDLYGLGATLLFLLTHKDPADFPEKRMKIDFRPYVNLTPEFADWLENLLEPVIEDRFTSAAEALAELEGKRERIAPRSPSNLQPAGSRVVLQKDQSRIKISIPGQGLEYQHIFLFIFYIIFLPTFFIITMGIFEDLKENFFMITIKIILFLLFIFSSIIIFIWNVFASTHLEFTKNKFTRTWYFLGIRHKIDRNIKDICRVEVSRTNVNVKERPAFTCALQMGGVATYCFGSRLSKMEQDWLVTEIAEFIGKPKLIDK
ncbi:serine/threonine protein kinase [Laspinema olomoucense]|uniref:non-specific serine/threonine protein kinase n=1 Tax=Laspinema olomoucense D3b TaxID=2953688 RepID=A0ABT2NAG2_9CYAN|nr:MULTISPECIES: serine/threonine-protein kinase [unclassified Laspinema]MCT7978261.1 serine/threonine protein kinase [Laspinema sp. D3b]MCT7988335.1 serine/threonine protein kinase [Laspinema sp. D3a]